MNRLGKDDHPIEQHILSFQVDQFVQENRTKLVILQIFDQCFWQKEAWPPKSKKRRSHQRRCFKRLKERSQMQRCLFLFDQRIDSWRAQWLLRIQPTGEFMMMREDYGQIN